MILFVGTQRSPGLLRVSLFAEQFYAYSAMFISTLEIGERELEHQLIKLDRALVWNLDRHICILLLSFRSGLKCSVHLCRWTTGGRIKRCAEDPLHETLEYIGQ